MLKIWVETFKAVEAVAVEVTEAAEEAVAETEAAEVAVVVTEVAVEAVEEAAVVV